MADELTAWDRKNAVCISRAFDTVQKMDLPATIDLEGDLFSLGPKMQKRAAKLSENIKESYGNQAPAFVALALKMYWFSAWSAAYWFDESIKDGTITGNASVRCHDTAESYVDEEEVGCAYTLFNELSQIDSNVPMFMDATFTEQPTLENILEAMALYWLHQANKAARSSNLMESMDYIHEAYDAFSLQDINRMWNDAERLTKENMAESDEVIKIAHSNMAKKGALARLRNDRRQSEKQFILECWRDWRADKHKYRSKAAFARDMIEKCERLTSTKKVEDWCREWEKEDSPI